MADTTRNTQNKMEKRTISHDDISEIIIMTAATVHCFTKGELTKEIALKYIEESSIKEEFKKEIQLVIEELSEESPKGSDLDIDKIYKTCPFYNILTIEEKDGNISMKFSFNDTEYIASLEADKECATFFCERNTGYNPNILIAMWEESLEDINLQKLMECVRDVIAHLS